MADAVELKVCIRCRPFSQKDRAGILLNQIREGQGEARLVNSEQHREKGPNRYGFAYTWNSAYNYKKFLDNDDESAEAYESVDQVSQEDVYELVGKKMLEELLHGQAVVMFAYGLSGAGKTYTVFGTDDPDSPHAWYRFNKPDENWGLFPRIAYDLLQLAANHTSWKVRVKYFQNVVDDVKDLLSKDGTSKNYKHGMHKDAHGFMDITWCTAVEVRTWEELLGILNEANKRKSIAPTQFNPSSTRGHCILFYEVDMPGIHHDGVTTTARMYVCDLAGAEPAADVHWARYKRLQVGDGKLEYVYQGRDPDKSKTQQLVEQGKKINLSLSETSLFFRKMSAAMKKHKNKLQPGETVVGCNNYFLGKFLKQTMLRAHTYLFAAVRPELKYQTYTRSTLDFAINASLVKLKPKRMNSHHVIVGKGAKMGISEVTLSQKSIDLENKHVSALRREVIRLRSKISGLRPPSDFDIQRATAGIRRSITLSAEQVDSAITALKSANTLYEVNKIVAHLLIKDGASSTIVHIKEKAKHLETLVSSINDLEKTKYLDKFEIEEPNLSESQRKAIIDAVWACNSKEMFDKIKACAKRHAEPYEIRDLIDNNDLMGDEPVESLWEAITDKNNNSHQQYLDAKEEVKHGKERIEALSLTNLNQKKRIKELESAMESYKEQAKAALKAMDEEHERTGKTNTDMRGKMKVLRDRMHEVDHETEVLKDKIQEAHKHEVQMLAQKDESYKLQIAALKSQLAAVTREKQSLDDEVKQKQQVVQSLTENLHDAQHELKLLRVSVQSVKQEHTHEKLRRASSQVLSSFRRQNQLKLEKKAQQNDQEKSGVIQKLNADLASKEDEIKKIEERLVNANNEIAEWKQKHCNLEADGVKDRSLMNATIDSLKKERVKLDDDYRVNLEKLKANLKDANDRISAVKKRSEERDRATLLDNARRESELEITSSKVKTLYQDIEKIKLEKSNAIHELDILKQDYEQEISTLQNLLATAQRDSARLHSKCQETEARSVAALDAKDQEIDRQTERVDDLKRSIQKLKKQHESEIFESKKSVGILQSQLESLQAQKEDYNKSIEKMKNNKLEAEQKAQLELETLEKDLTGLIRQRADQLANKNVELEQIKTQMVQTERMLMDERRESSKLRHQYDEEKERRMSLLKSHESSSESVQELLSRLQSQQKEMKGFETKLRESKQAHEASAKAHLQTVRVLKDAKRLERKELMEKCEALETELAKCRRQINSLKSSDAKLEKLQVELSDANHTLRVERSMLATKEDALNAIKKTLESTLEANKSTEEEFYQKCEELRQVKAELRKVNQNFSETAAVANAKERSFMEKNMDKLHSKIMDLRTALDDQRSQTNEYKELYEDAKDEMEDLKASTASKISEKTNAMRNQTNKEIVGLRTQLESTKRKFQALSLKFSDVAQEKKEIEADCAAQIKKSKECNEKQVEMVKEALRESNNERDIALEHANEIKARYSKSAQKVESLADANNRRDVKILSLEKNREDDAKLIKQLYEHKDNALSRNQELEEALAVSQSNLDRQRELCDKLGNANAVYREQDVERRKMIIKCQSMMDELFNVGIVEAQLLRVARSPRQQQFRSRRGKKMASLVLENSARHMRNLLIEDNASNRFTRRQVKSRFLTPTKKRHNDTFMKDRDSETARPKSTGRMYASVANRNHYTSPDLDVNDLRSTGPLMAQANNSFSPQVYSSDPVDEYSDEGIIYTGKAINENLKTLSQSFNVLMRQMNLQGSEV